MAKYNVQERNPDWLSEAQRLLEDVLEVSASK